MYFSAASTLCSSKQAVPFGGEIAVNLHASHLSFATIVDWVEQRLPAAARVAAQAHIDRCARCAAQADEVKRLVTLMQTDDLEDAPPAVIQRSIGLFQPPSGGKAATQAALRHILAVLGFDSGAMQPAVGFRAEQPVARQLLFHADGHDLDLRLTPTGAEWTIAGQVLGTCDSGAIELAGPQRTVRAALNQLCEFLLPPVPSGTYRLVLYLPAAVVEVTSLAVGL